MSHDQSYAEASSVTFESPVSMETANYVADIGNHEAKLLTSFYLPGLTEAQGKSEMHRGFMDFVGEDSIWKPSLTMPIAYCQKSFIDAQHVEPVMLYDRDRSSVGYRLTEAGRTAGIAVSGLLAEWSLDNPDLSIQKALGLTRTSGEVKPTFGRLRVLSSLHKSIGELSLVDLSGQSDRHADRANYSNTGAAVTALVRDGIAIKSSTVIENDTMYDIISHERPELSRSELSNVVGGVYAYLRHCETTATTAFSYKDCLAYITDYLSQDGAIVDEAQIRARLTLALTGQTVLPGIRAQKPDRKLTRVSLRDDLRPAISELLDIVMAVEDQDQIAMKKGKSVATTISGDNTAKTRLFDKAYRFSLGAHEQAAAETKQALLNILSKAESALSTEQIVQECAAIGRSLTGHLVQNYLRELSSKGAVTIALGRVSSSRTKQLNHYSIPEQQ